MTKNRRRVDFAEITTPILEKYDAAAGFCGDAYRELERSDPQRLVNRACKNEATLIRAVIAARDIEEMIALELRLQNNDLGKYARSESEIKAVGQGIADWHSAMHMYNILKTNSKQYKELSKGFTDRNRDKRLDVPKDGMRYALSSQSTRLQNRHSLQLSEEEKDLLVVRRDLVDAMTEEYSLLQTDLLHEKP